MNVIGKLLPVDGYAIKMNAAMPVDYTTSLTHLYQPLIGIEATALYLTLAEGRHIQKNNTPQTHHTLMSYLNVPLDRIYRARLKLEAIGLLKTFQAKTEETVYLYELQPPFSPAGFFNDAMLAQLLYHHIGEDRFKQLKQHFVTEQALHKEKEITASFQDVFQTFVPDGNAIVNESNSESAAASPPLENIDFTWMTQMLKQRMIPVRQVLTPHNKKLIAQMMSLYGLTQLDLEKALLWALTEDNRIDELEFQTACHDLFKAAYQNQPIQLQEKELSATAEDVRTDKPATKEEQLIQRLETMSPKELLEDLSGGGQASEQDMKIIAEVMTAQNLPTPVMNVLIHYVLLQSDMRLTKNYLAKIASHWSRAKLKNASEAMNFAKEQVNKRTAYQNKQKNYRKPHSREVIPDWFIERQEQEYSQPETSSDNQLDDAQEREKLAALLKEFSEGSKKQPYSN